MYLCRKLLSSSPEPEKPCFLPPPIQPHVLVQGRGMETVQGDEGGPSPLPKATWTQTLSCIASVLRPGLCLSSREEEVQIWVALPITKGGLKDVGFMRHEVVDVCTSMYLCIHSGQTFTHFHVTASCVCVQHLNNSPLCRPSEGWSSLAPIRAQKSFAHPSSSSVQWMCAWTRAWDVHKTRVCERFGGFGEHQRKLEPVSTIVNAELFTTD